MKKHPLCAAFFAILLTGFNSQNLTAWQSDNVGIAAENMLATVNPIATDAGVAAFEAGGNAVDAAVAAALMLSVVDGYNSGIGGGCFILIRRANGEVVAIDGREMAPSAAHRDMYLTDGKPDTSLSQEGPLAIGVPGALKAYEQAVGEFGNQDFASLVLPAAKRAREGFSISPTYASVLKLTSKSLAKYPGSKQVFLNDDGLPRQAGERLVQSDLANTLERVANEGVDYFYRGDFAKQTAQWMQQNGGLITEADFANYLTRRRKPVETTYRGHTIIGFPPPSSGGVHVAEILNILEAFDLNALREKDPATYVHVVAEAMKLAFADRAYWLGDPDFAEVPLGLIDKNYAAELARKIDLQKVTPVASHGTPPLADAEFFERHTTHIAAADDRGNWVAITTTVNTSFGSKVVIPGLGVIMNNQMDDFAVAPGIPNAYGLIGTEANCVQPGKRPLSSMSPTIVMKGEQPFMTVGAAGGPRIITQALLAIVGKIDLGMSLEQAVGQKRFHHQWSPDLLMLEKDFPPTIKDQLENMGHRVRVSNRAGVSQAIIFDSDGSRFVGVHDPRVPGKAAGVTRVPTDR
ncbi:MAG: gamma-glutamyltransferase [Pirellulaceae bacterium]|nr:gamma-glutamyltransferase [Pirellulaceae bacterium]